MKRYLVVDNKTTAKSIDARYTSELDECIGHKASKYITIGKMAKTSDGKLIVEIPPEFKDLLKSLQDNKNIYDEIGIRKLLPRGEE